MSPQQNIKFSHRLFSQYFISAVIPVLVLVLISFYTVSGMLEKNASRLIYAESRAVGLTLYDRLLTIENNLIDIAKSIEQGRFTYTDKQLNRIYSSLYLVDSQTNKEDLMGTLMPDFDLSYFQKAHLEKHKRLLLIKTTEANQTELMMLHILDSRPEKILVAIINKEYLWDITTKESDVYCAVSGQSILLHCSDYMTDISRIYGKNTKIFETNKKDLKAVVLSEEEYLGNAWDVFLEANFGIDSISIVYFMPKKNVLRNYEYYINTLPLSITITLLLVFVLSSVQMRRSLKPLVSLMQGARNIIAGDYTRSVEIKSNDEFETLANTFNDMSHRINGQFKKINTLSKIDRLILSTPDSDYIVEVLIEYIPTVIKADNVAILINSQDSPHSGVLFYNEDTSFKSLKKTNIIIDESEREQFESADSIVKKTDEDASAFLNPLVKLGNKTFFICAIKNKEDFLGLICIGWHEDEQDKEMPENDLLEISDRTAVALSNANWEKKLFHQAHYDALTKIPNRHLFQDRLEQAMERARRSKLNVAILFIDLDRFKSVNDSLGHAVGDQLLVEVSDLLVQCVRSYDSVARFGGDEFVIIISDLADDEVNKQSIKLSSRIIESMTDAFIIDDREFYVSPSIGIAVYPRDAKDVNDLLKNADAAMYEAKSISQGNYQFYKKQLNMETLAQLELENDLRHALELDQFELYFQPKVNLRNCMIYDVEALIRWNHPDRGVIPPTLFIPLAEETGLITNIGYWVMRNACQQSKIWSDKGIELNVAVNVSADQFRQPSFYNKVVDIIEQTGAKPSSLEIEITESITIENFGKTIKLLNKLREYGLSICMDDFGTGYSSMTYLQKMPVNKLKIDKSFVDNIHLDSDSASITKAIVALAHNLDLTVVAEGVETKAQYDYLNAISCDEAQGFFLSRPLQEEALIKHILVYNSRSAKIDHNSRLHKDE